MAYSADSFVADEQPTTAKWNKLWSNDAAFNDGTGIANAAINENHVSGISKANLTTDSNAYKFSAWRNAAYSPGTGLVSLVFDTETFDTNNNYDTSNGRYTAPRDGYWAFFWGLIVSCGAGDTLYTGIAKNGTEHKRCQEIPSTASGNNTVGGGAFINLSSGDYATVYMSESVSRALVVGNQAYVWFNGFNISKT